VPTVVKTIGSGGGRDYSTLAAWAASLPANLVTDGNSYEGDCYNDSEFTGSATLLTLSGHTTDASHTITLTTGPGQSFRDNANVQTNALNYSSSNGVGINSSVAYAGTISITDSNVFLSNLQIKNTGSHGRVLISEGTSLSIVMDDCIFVKTGTSAYVVAVSGGGQKIRNSLLLAAGSGISYILAGSLSTGVGMPDLYFCDLVAASDVGTPPIEAIHCVYSSSTVENCAIFGCAALSGGSTTITFTSCMTDLASPPAGVTGSKTYAKQFQNTTAASGDFREKAGADLQGSGTADGTNGATDIAGTARPQGGHWDIGCWELLISVTIVAADAWMPIALLPTQRVDQPVRIELIATQRGDLRTPLESLTILRSDRGLRVEDSSGVARDTAGRIEWAAQAVTEWRAATEWPTLLLRNLAATGEFTAALAWGAPISPEWMEAIATLLSADAVLQVDWSGLPASVLVSLDRLLTSPGKRRRLDTPGRLRLLKPL